MRVLYIYIYIHTHMMVIYIYIYIYIEREREREREEDLRYYQIVFQGCGKLSLLSNKGGHFTGSK